ncbi:MAG TPA: hypothetical protein VNK94_08815 [Gaiellaceae bacterium]|nr:hypothetical protein [Gaiellaceae bacterium]
MASLASTNAAREHGRRLALQPPAPPGVELRPKHLDDPDEPVRRRQAAELLPVQTLRPEAVAVAAHPERLGALPARLAPALVSRPLEHEPGSAERPGRAPHDLLGLVRDVRAHERVQAIGEGTARGEAPGDEQDPRLPAEERGFSRLGQLLPTHEVGALAEALEGRERELGEVEAALRVPAPAELVEREEHAGAADVEVLQRARRVPAVPVVGPPEELRPAQGRIGVCDDLADPGADALLAPRLGRQPFEGLGAVEH